MSKFTTEVLIARVEIENSGEPIQLPPRYHRLFEREWLETGFTVIRFPIKDRELSKDATDFQRDFPQLKYNITSKNMENY